MYRLKEIQDKLMHLVGWQQDYSDDVTFDPKLEKTESGLYFQGAHPLVTLNNIRSNMPELFAKQYPTWSSGITYAEGSIVKTDLAANDPRKFQLWQAQAENLGDQPGTNDDIWKPISGMTQWLENLTRNAIADTVRSFATQGILHKMGRSLLDHKTFYDGSGKKTDVIPNSSSLVGFELMPVRSMGITVKVERIGLQMRGAAGKLPIYVFHSSKLTPHYSIEVDLSGQNTFQWFETPDLYLPYISDDTNSGGSWFVVYDQEQLPQSAQAINLSRDYGRIASGMSCCGNNNQFADWTKISAYMEIYPFRTPAPYDFPENPELWDVSQNMRPGIFNWGMNMEVSIACDLTEFITRQRALFADALQLQLAVNFLTSLITNPNYRINRTQNNISLSYQELHYELDGDSRGSADGLLKRLERVRKAIRLDTQGIDRFCIPCNDGGVKYTTV